MYRKLEYSPHFEVDVSESGNGPLVCSSVVEGGGRAWRGGKRGEGSVSLPASAEGCTMHSTRESRVDSRSDNAAASQSMTLIWTDSTSLRLRRMGLSGPIEAG